MDCGDKKIVGTNDSVSCVPYKAIYTLKQL